MTFLPSNCLTVGGPELGRLTDLFLLLNAQIDTMSLTAVDYNKPHMSTQTLHSTREPC